MAEENSIAKYDIIPKKRETYGINCAFLKLNKAINMTQRYEVVPVLLLSKLNPK